MTAAVSSLPASRDWRPYLALFAGTVFIASSPLFARWAELGPLASAFWRMALSLPLLALWVRLAPAPRVAPQPATARDRWLVAAAGLAFAADLGLFHVALVHTSVANASLLSHLAPLVTIVAAWAVWGERPTAKLGLGFALALSGGAVMASERWIGAGSVGGDLAAVASAVCYGLYFVAIKAAQRRLSAGLVMLGSSAVAAGSPSPRWDCWCMAAARA
jgi:drug/metabolite transporter (DMT)-like permease